MLVLLTANPIVKQIKQYIQEHINEQITLKDVAQSLFFSPVYCSAIFKKETGISIIDYCLNEKIKSAKKLIIAKKMARRYLVIFLLIYLRI